LNTPSLATALPDLRSRDTYRAWTRVVLRYNAVTPMFFEEARCSVIYPVLQAGGRRDLDLVLVKTVIDYVQELSYPGAVDIGTRIHRIGTKSLHLVHGVFDATSGACTATGECIVVIFDQKSRASVAPPDDVRARLQSLM
jgi:acyl-CoA thioester hydrolase